MKSIIWVCLIVNICLCLLLELFFKHSTNLVQTIEMFQLISFSYYLSTMYPYDLSATYLNMIKTHIALLIPPLYLPVGINGSPTGKFTQTGIQGVLVFDGQGIFVGYFLLLVLVAVIKLVKTGVDPRSSRSTFNACSWLLDKLKLCLLLWFRLTVMVLFASATIMFQNFDRSSNYYLASLGFFMLIVALMIIMICVKKWDEDSKTYQFLLVYNSSYDYKQKK